jgi:hypothetical protein
VLQKYTLFLITQNLFSFFSKTAHHGMDASTHHLTISRSAHREMTPCLHPHNSRSAHREMPPTLHPHNFRFTLHKNFAAKLVLLREKHKEKLHVGQILNSFLPDSQPVISA